MSDVKTLGTDTVALLDECRSLHARLQAAGGSTHVMSAKPLLNHRSAEEDYLGALHHRDELATAIERKTGKRPALRALPSEGGSSAASAASTKPAATLTPPANSGITGAAKGSLTERCLTWRRQHPNYHPPGQP